MNADWEKAKAYQRKKYFIALFHLGLQIVLLALLILSGLTSWFEGRAQSIAAQFYGQATVYYAFFFAFFLVFDFPFALYSGFFLERAYGLSNQNFRGWLAEFLKKVALSFAFSLALILGLYFLIRQSPERWWVWAWLAFAGVSYLLGQLFPVLIVPLFYRYSRVENETLREKIFALVKRFGLPLENVYSLNLSKTTKKANAMFAGLGRTKRLVLSDTLIQNFTAGEIESVVAHELGHFKHKDIWYHLGFNCVTSFISFGFAFYLFGKLFPRWGYAGAHDLAAFPLLYLIFFLFGILLTPLSNAYSRWREREADRFALQASGPQGFIPAMEKLGRLNLADPKPHPLIEWWFYTHPPIEKRIRMAKTFVGAFILALAVLFQAPGFAQEESEREEARKRLETRGRTEILQYYLGSSKNETAPQMPVAIELYNQAVEFYTKREFELAREAAQDSLAYDPKNPFAHELLGDIAYYEQKLDEALEAYEAAFRLSARKDLREKILRVQKEKEIEGGLQTLEGDYFLLKYKEEEKGLEGFELREYLAKAYREVGRDLGYFFKRKVVVLLYDAEEFKQLSGLPHWSVGVYDGKIRLPAYSRGFTPKEIEKFTRHEVTHAFVVELSQGKCPVWLNEGLAEYEEAKVEPQDLRVFEAAVRTQTLFPLEVLFSQEKLLKMKDPLEAALFYDQSYHFVAYLIERYGMFRIRKMLDLFAQGKDSFEAVEEALGISVPEIEKQWKETFQASESL